MCQLLVPNMFKSNIYLIVYMVVDPYLWAKKKITDLVEKIKDIEDGTLRASPGDIWSIKKILVLDYYIGEFVRIIRKNGFDRWFFVDTHCGTGLITFRIDSKNEKFPGSPLIAAFRNVETPFTDYFFSDIDPKSISLLDSRLKSLKNNVGIHDYKPVVRSFEDSVKFIEGYKRRGTAFLIFIDPKGFAEIRWDLMKRLLSIQTADIFFTFMTPYIARHQSAVKTNESMAETMTLFFGNQNWKDLKNGDELLEQYISQMKGFKKHVLSIPIFKTGKIKLYDLIIATNSDGAKNIISDDIKTMSIIPTEILKSALQVIVGKQSDLSQFTDI